nr:Tm-1-like ATP-binding domain-containing protein [Thermus thermamylovorans]
MSKLSRAEAIAAMGKGAGRVLVRLWSAGLIQGALALGGNQGSAAGGTALQALPLGVPKILLSTVASGNIRPFVGSRDIFVIFSVVDFVGGPNQLSRQILSRAATSLLQMARSWGALLPSPDLKNLVALSALGNTTPLVENCLQQLPVLGMEGVVFHASGAGGAAMEDLIRAGWFSAVLDLTTHELVGEALGYDIYTPTQPGRLQAAAELGLPMVVSVGGLDYYVFGAPSTIPEHLRDRKTLLHNPFNANVALKTEEFARVAEALCHRLNPARGPVALIIPLKGFSQYGEEGGPFWNPEGIEIFVRTVQSNLSSRHHLHILNAPINSSQVVKVAISELRKFLGGGRAKG